jgi:hypothetical protein
MVDVKKMSIPEKRRLFAERKHPETWEEFPVDPITFIESDDYLGLDKQTWPSVKKDIGALFAKTKDGEDRYNEAVFCEGKGSGKSHKSGLISAYMAYLVLCLKNPQKHFGLAPGDTIAIVNMSTTAQQAKKVVYKKTKDIVRGSSWFTEYGEPDPRVTTELRFPKDLLLIPGNSRSETSLGFTVILGIMDECAFYKSTKFEDRAEDIRDELKSQQDSRFTKPDIAFKPKMVYISYPKHKNDFISRKLREAQNDPKMLSRHRAVWEAKPPELLAEETFVIDGEEIPVNYKKNFEKNPEKSWRIYGARPSLTLEPYFKEFDRIRNCIDPDRKAPVKQGGEIKDARFFGKPSKSYNIHVDIGISRDACGLCMSHRESQNLIWIDLILQIKPKRGREIQITAIEEMISYLKRERRFPIRRASFDGFQSAQIRQNLSRDGIDTEYLSIDRDLKAYDTLKDWFYTENINMYLHEALMEELEHLELVAGKKVDHTPMFSKDVADAVAGSVYWSAKDRGYGEEDFSAVAHTRKNKDKDFDSDSFHDDGVGGSVIGSVRRSNRLFPKGNRRIFR